MRVTWLGDDDPAFKDGATVFGHFFEVGVPVDLPDDVRDETGRDVSGKIRNHPCFTVDDAANPPAKAEGDGAAKPGRGRKAKAEGDGAAVS